MHTEQIVAILIAERDRLNRAIEALRGTVARRGRPPKNPAALAAAPAAKRKRKPRTAAQKKAQSERMKKFWAERKKKG